MIEFQLFKGRVLVIQRVICMFDRYSQICNSQVSFFQQQFFDFGCCRMFQRGFQRVILSFPRIDSYLLLVVLLLVVSGSFDLEVGSLTSGNWAAIYLKNYWMLLPVLALTSLKIMKLRSASYLPSLQDTSRSYKSTLLASSAMITPSPRWFFTSSIHFCTLLKDSLFVTSQTITATDVSLMQLGIRALNLYWPAVSHSCRRMVLSSRKIFWEIKSIPIVGL